MANDPTDPPAQAAPKRAARRRLTRQASADAGKLVAMPPLQYEEAWIYYRDHSRKVRDVQERFGLSRHKADVLVNHGWPAMGLAALKDRALEHDRQKRDAETKAMADALREKTDAWYRAGKQFNGLADFAINTGLGALQTVLRAVTTLGPDGKRVPRQLTKMVKRRVKVWEGDGEDRKQVSRLVDEEVPLTVPECLRVMREVMQAMEQASTFKRNWPIRLEEEAPVQAGPPPGLGSLTPEHIAHIAETGELPEGITEDDLLGLGVKPQPGGNNKGN